MLRPQFEYDYTSLGAFRIYLDIEPKDRHQPFALEIHIFGRSFFFGIGKAIEKELK